MILGKRHKLLANVIGISLLVVFAALAFQLGMIQLFHHNRYEKMAKSQHFKRIEIPARRGPIFDRNGNKLAESIRVSSVCADPWEVSDKYPTASKLADILGMDESEVFKLLDKDKRFVWIKRRITDIEEIEINRCKLKGIYTRYEYKRLYPMDELASHVVGITDIDGNGLEGIELAFDNLLRGTNGYMVVEKDGLQRHITNINNIEVQPEHGSGILLTIDKVIQQYVEEEIDRAFIKHLPKSITAIVMVPSTGEILAMANHPTFNPNNFTRSPSSSRRNRAVTDCFEPGSLIKPVIVSALFKHGLAMPEDSFFCYNGEYRMGRRVLHDTHGYGNLTVSEIVAKSSNIGMAQIGAILGPKRLYGHLRDTGFGEKLNIELPGEIEGILRPLNSWTSYSVPSISMGQEISATPLQLINAFCCIANGGIRIQPTIVAGLTTNDGKTITHRAKLPKVIKRVLSHGICRDKVNPILVRVVNEGTGKAAVLSNYQVAGKTGTSQKLDNNQTYSHTRFISSFIGYAPAESPIICVLVVVDEPKGEYYGGTVAAPIVKNILENSIDYLLNGRVNSPYLQMAMGY